MVSLQKKGDVVNKIIGGSIIWINVLIAGLSPVEALQKNALITDSDWAGIGQAQGIYFCKTCKSSNFISQTLIDAQGILYVTGYFWTAGGMKTNGVAKWDGLTWSKSDGWDFIDEGMYSNLTSDGNGTFYAIRNLLSSGVQTLVTWNGNAWIALGNNFTDQVNELIADKNGTLYALGDFNSTGDGTARHLAKWDGGKWIALGNGIFDDIWSIMDVFVIDDSGNLYAGGKFDSVGPVKANNIAKWDGKVWSALGNGFTNRVTALAIGKDGVLYAGGWFDSTGDVPVHHIAKWIDGSWNNLGDGIHHSTDGGMPLWALAFDDLGNLYAGGYFDTAGTVKAHSIAKWDGSTWSSLGSGIGGINGSVDDILFDRKGNLIVSGNFSIAGGKGAENIALWNGAEWSPLGQKDGNGLNNTVNSLVTTKDGHIYAGGYCTTGGIKTLNYIAKWEDTTWIAVGPGLNSPILALAADSAGNLYAGGKAGPAGSPLLAKWDGTAWSFPGNGQFDGYTAIDALVVDKTGVLYAGGNIGIAGKAEAHIVKWNGSSWSEVGNGFNGQVSSLAFDHNGVLYAGGNFNAAGSIIAHHIAKWDGGVWSSLGSGTNDSISVLAVDNDNNLYAGGGFDYAGSITAHHIAKWDGSTWNSFGNGTLGIVDAIAIDDHENIYVGGTFDLAGSISAYNIAKWGGSAWSNLGCGTDGNVSALIIDKNILYTGGNFTTAGGKASACFALCTLTNDTKVAYSRRGKASAAPLCTYEAGTGIVRIQLESETFIDFRMYSLTGRRVYCVLETRNAGEHVYRIPTAGLASGAYIAQVKAGNESMRFKVVLPGSN